MSFFDDNKINIVNSGGVGQFEGEGIEIGYWKHEDESFVITEDGAKIIVEQSINNE